MIAIPKLASQELIWTRDDLGFMNLDWAILRLIHFYYSYIRLFLFHHAIMPVPYINWRVCMLNFTKTHSPTYSIVPGHCLLIVVLHVLHLCFPNWLCYQFLQKTMK